MDAFDYSIIDVDLLDAWVDALESNEYQQGKNFLRSSETEFCCLGVLCDVTRKREGHRAWGDILYDSSSTYFVFESNNDNRIRRASSLPNDIAGRIGLTEFGARLDGECWNIDFEDGEEGDLSAANDNGVSFKEIAKEIRNYANEVRCHQLQQTS